MNETIIETKASFATLYQSLVESEKDERHPPENYFTAKQFAGDTGTNPTVAARKLNKMRDEGALESGRYIVDGCWTTCYWFAKDGA